MRHMQVMVDGLLTTYEMSGRGKPVVLLHGWGDRAKGLASVQAALAKQFTVIVPDLPGFGATEPPKIAWDLTAYAQFVAAFLEKIGVTEVYAYVGHSNGGSIALRGLGRDLLSADKLVLLASAGIRSSYNAHTKVQRLFVKAGKVFVMPLPLPVKRKLRRKVYDAVGSDMLVAEHLQATFKKIVADDVQADAAKIGIPTLLMYGEQDRATPVEYGELFHELLLGSTLEIVADAGHFLYLDQPGKVMKRIMEFLA